MRFLRIVVTVVFLVSLLSLSGCGGGSSSSKGEESKATAENAEATQSDENLPVSYIRDVQPIFQEKCVYCHHPNNAMKVDLTQPFDPEVGIINRPNSWTKSEKKFLVVPGDPDASSLVWKVEQRDLDPKVDGNYMPWQVPRVTAEELLSMRAWIEAGAKDDETFKTEIAPIFGDGVSLGAKGGKCAYCHYSGASFGPDLTDVFNPKTGAVGVPAVRGGSDRIVPGDAYASILYVRSSAGLLPANLTPLMPWRILPLTDEEQATIREWIQNGAKND